MAAAQAAQAQATQAAQTYVAPGLGEVIAWYERDFAVPADWLAAPESVVQVTFGACGYETRVWLNGVPLRTVEGEEAHVGEYTSFSYELPPEHLAATNRLTVRVADSLDPDMPRGKQESRVYKRGGIWYQTISGPMRSVWLEPVERNRLRSRLSVVSAIQDRLVEIGVTMRVHDPGLYRLRLAVSARGSDRPSASTEVELPLEVGETRQRLALEIPDAQPWSPASPALYQLVAQLSDPHGHVSQIESRFGLRTAEARGKCFYLNGERLYLDGILYQPATATFDEMRRHMAGMRELGRANHWDELQRLLVQIGAHPSVVILSLYNEDWGAEDIATNPETRAYVARAYAHLRLDYPQLLVVDNDGWQHVSAEGRLRSDLLTVHSYQTETSHWREVLDRLVAGEHDSVAYRPLTVGDPFFFGGQLPLVVSEWGGFGFSMYGGPKELGARADRIRAFKRELTDRPIAGDVYTQATGIEEERNGLLDARTGALLVPAGLLASRRAD
jgi:hypothetical protein